MELIRTDLLCGFRRRSNQIKERVFGRVFTKAGATTTALVRQASGIDMEFIKATSFDRQGTGSNMRFRDRRDIGPYLASLQLVALVVGAGGPRDRTMLMREQGPGWWNIAEVDALQAIHGANGGTNITTSSLPKLTIIIVTPAL